MAHLAGLEKRDWFAEPCLLGIDEAGRGPVLGPMVYACCFAAISERDALAKREFADSKTLKEEKREQLFNEIRGDKSLGYAFDSISATHISQQMLAKCRVSLNEVATLSTIKLIRAVLDAGANVQEVYIDTVGDPQRHSDRLSREFPVVNFTVCPKADALYPIVSAASIVAKVTRDQQLRECHQALGADYASPVGTGYPGDPDTKAWLAKHVTRVTGFPPIVRFSWDTAARLLEEHAMKVEWESDDGNTGQPLLSFTPVGAAVKQAASSGETSGAGRHSFFRVRKLQRVAF